MKKIFYLLLLISTTAISQRYEPVTSTAIDSTKVLTTQGGQSKWTWNVDLGKNKLSLSDLPTTYGRIYNKNTWSNLNDFVSYSSGVGVVSSKLQFTGGNNDLLKTLQVNGGTCLERWQVTGKIKIDEKSATSYGNGVGVKSTNTWLTGSDSNQYSIIAKFDASTGANSGKISIQGSVPIGAVATSTSAISFSAGDYILLTMRRNMDTLTAYAQNLTTSSAIITTQYVFFSGLSFQNTGRFAIANYGGQFTVDSLSVTSNEIKNAELAIVGDSKTTSTGATLYNYGWNVNIARKFRTVNLGGGGNRTSDILNQLPEIITLKPKQVIICIGRNDVASGVSTATWQANYASIVSQLTAAGIKVYHLTGMNETTTAYSAPQATYVSATYGTDVIDTYSPTVYTPNTIAADNTHPNDLGHTLVYNTIINSGKLAGGNNYSELIGLLGATRGGTGITTYTTGDLIYSDFTNHLSKLPAVATGSVIVSQGVGAVPVYSSTPSVTSITTTSSTLNGGFKYDGTSNPGITGYNNGTLKTRFGTATGAGSFFGDVLAGDTYERTEGGTIRFGSNANSNSSIGIDSVVKVNAALSLPYVAKTANYTATKLDHTIDCTANSFTVTLPTAVGINGRVYIIKNSGAGTITMAATNGQTFDAVASPTIAAGAVAQYQSNGANWIKIN